MTNFDPARYRIVVQLQTIEDEDFFVATAAELPDAAVYESSYEAAYKGLIDVIGQLKEAAAEEGRPFPDPVTTQTTHSGRATVRMPKTLHASLDREAVAEGVSLNTLIVSLLTDGLARKAVAMVQGYEFQADVMTMGVGLQTPIYQKIGNFQEAPITVRVGAQRQLPHNFVGQRMIAGG